MLYSTHTGGRWTFVEVFDEFLAVSMITSREYIGIHPLGFCSHHPELHQIHDHYSFVLARYTI